MRWQFWRTTWQPIETAPENPERKYLAVDTLGNIHLTDHPRHVLMYAGWAKAWIPIPEWKTKPPANQSIQDGGRDIAAMHAREFKRLVKAHGIAGETIEGVKVVGSAR